MKFVVSRTELLSALTITGKAISQSSIAMPILGNYLFRINDTEMEVCASNLEIYISNKINIESNGLELSVCIPATRLLKLIKDLPDQPLAFTFESTIESVKQVNDTCKEVEKITTLIKAFSGNYTIPAENGEDFPIMENEYEFATELPAEDLFEGFYKSVFACSKDTAIPSFNGVGIEFDEDKIRFTGANPNLISTILLSGNTGIASSIILSDRVISVLQSFAITGLISLKFNSKSISFSFNNDTVLSAVLIDDKIPAYRDFIPVDNNNVLSCYRTELISALKRAVPFSYENYPLVKLSINKDEFIITAQNFDLANEAKETIKHSFKGEEIIIGSNGNYLISALLKLTTEDVYLSFSAPDRAFILTESEPVQGDKENLMLIMPITLN